jgi:hypothetical protein
MPRLHIPMGIDLAGQVVEIQINYRPLPTAISISRVDLNLAKQICDSRSCDEILEYNEAELTE